MVTTGIEYYFKIIQVLFKVLEQGNKTFQKSVETRLHKKPESIYSPIARQSIHTEIKSNTICQEQYLF